MTALRVETDWSPRQVARGRDVVWRTEMGYHWTEPFGRPSWLAHGIVYLAILALLATHMVTIVSGARPLDPTAFIFGFCAWGILYFPPNLLNWARNGFVTHWPSRGMMTGLDHGPAEVTIDGGGIAWSREHYGESLAWGAITLIAEDRDFFVLGSGASLVTLLPKTPRVRLALERATDGLAAADALRAAR
ncbi:MAG TPA: YcxB family protein [Thermohalobaculum sp.]|nr:YcxB family protein [Thermohalobaculum sp.]